MTGKQQVQDFQDEVWRYYDANARRELPWRQPEADDGSFDPYKIMVSELMLQQTQVSRVIPKYLTFLGRFPDVQSLAAASLGEVLVAWQGLGYNRRAKFLWQAAQMVAGQLHGEFPQDQKSLTGLPGVGINTAGAIMAYAHNKPVVFLETNIRTVYIHHFFADQQAIPDKDIAALVAETLPDTNCREWYWALMDYGTYIKQLHGNKSRASKTYTRQSPFEGSRRKVRGAVIRQLGRKPASYHDLAQQEKDARLPEVLEQLAAEGMIVKEPGADGKYRLA